MNSPRRKQDSTRRIGIAIAVLLVAAGALAFVLGRDTGKPATAATSEFRRPANVKPAKLPPLRIRKTASGDTVISLDSEVFFAFDSAKLTDGAGSRLRRQVLPRVLAVLGRPGTGIDLRGYTDGVGEAAYNQRLSLQRAAAVRGFLVAAGAPADRLDARGFGEQLASSAVRDRSLRRVDVVLGEGGPE